jgi:signal peptidase I
MDDALTCARCGAAIASDAAFCGKCGLVRQPPTEPVVVAQTVQWAQPGQWVFCVRCGGPAAAGTTFCGHCGAVLAVQSAPPIATEWAPTPKKGHRTIAMLLAGFVVICVVVSVGFVVVKTALADQCTDSNASLYTVYQVGMEPTFEPGQKLLVKPSNGAVGEIVVFNPPTGYADKASDPFIKRVVGVAGDLVEVHDGAVWVNGVKLAEPYVYDGAPTVPRTEVTSWRVPAGDLFVMGDHRDASEDSREFGPIAKSTVIGQVTYRCFPSTVRGSVH